MRSTACQPYPSNAILIQALVACLFLGLLVLYAVGCGVKAPPVAPEAKPPVIADLQYALENGRLNLSWRLAGGSPVAQTYTVYQSREPLTQKPCPGCPLRFKRIMTLPSGGRASKSESLPIETGYRYAFKITATDSSGLEGPASRTVKFSY